MRDHFCRNSVLDNLFLICNITSVIYINLLFALVYVRSRIVSCYLQTASIVWSSNLQFSAFLIASRIFVPLLLQRSMR